LATTRQKRREQRLQSALLDRLTFKYQRLIAKEIGRTMANINVTDPLGIEEAEQEHKQRLDKLLNRMWNESADQMIEQTFGVRQKALLGSFEPTIGVNSIMRDYTRIFGLKKIVQIASTTIKQVRGLINRGIDEGLSERETSRLLREQAPILSASRAQTIARTETHAAANYAVQESFKSTGIEARREWVSAEDERTREDHKEANGQIVGINEPFIVGSDELMYPGDPSGSPEQVINCRCAVVFVFD
jgi:SPP1 gp7 family putative phage head morphogenesis protein